MRASCPESRRRTPVVPELTELSNTLWTALLAGVSGAYLVRLSQREEADTEDLVTKSRRSVPRGLWECAADLAHAHGTDPAMLRSILLVENLQRPRWMRRLESLKARLGLEGTYGIMQLRADRPLTDEESLRLSLERHLAGVRPARNEFGVTDIESVRALARRHNRDPAFVEMVADFYRHLAER